MSADDIFPPEVKAGEEAVERAFGAVNRNRLIDLYFQTFAVGPINPSDAWKHIYRLLLWSDPTTGLAHCYESDKSQPGKPWYRRSLAFHDWTSKSLAVSPADLAEHIDWLFVAACSDLASSAMRQEERLIRAAAQQRIGYEEFPVPGSDPELSSIIRDLLKPYFSQMPSEEVWRNVTKQVRGFLAVQNKRKNLVGEGFEDVLAQVVRRTCHGHVRQVLPRHLLYEIAGFNRSRIGGKENKVDLAIVQPNMRTIVTAKEALSNVAFSTVGDSCKRSDLSVAGLAIV